MKESMGNSYVLYHLDWDTEYFGMKSGKAILHEPLTFDKWKKLKKRFLDYVFVTIENQNSHSINAQYIGKDTTAFLADVNIQFLKQIKDNMVMPENISVYQSLNESEQVIEIANFQHSRFIEDIRLYKLGGDKVYHEWLKNAFNKLDKYYVLSKNENNEINGFLLHSYKGDTCIIELIAVSQYEKQKGIGTSLVKAVECTAYRQGCNYVKVGTQVQNISAINFYHKLGFKQVNCHQVFHLWNNI